jgi:Kef-type K+ transport system membrane component KefB
MEVKLEVFLDIDVLLLALALTATAFASKIAAGLCAGKVDKWIVGWGMAPRGEVCLIFAVTGKNLNLISDEIFSMIIIAMMLTTLIPPLVLNHLLKKRKPCE